MGGEVLEEGGFDGVHVSVRLFFHLVLVFPSSSRADLIFDGHRLMLEYARVMSPDREAMSMNISGFDVELP